MDNNAFSNDNTTQPINNTTSEVPPSPTPTPTPTDPPVSPEFSESPKPHSQKKIIIWTICIVVVVLVCVLGIIFIPKLFEKPDEPTEEPTPTGQQNYESLESVNLGFLKQENNSSNIIYSPLSIRNGLSLLKSGASGKTEDEIDGLLTSAKIPKYQNISDKLSLANAIFINNTFKDKVLSSYTDDIQTNYNGEVLYDSFESTNNMDNWVKQKTFSLIDSIGVLVSPQTTMVLTNALAIQMDWEHQFDTDRTHGNSFYQKDGTEIQATTMHMDTTSSDIKYYIDDDTTALSMPLDSTSKDVNLDFIAIMPSGDLDEYINTVNQSKIDNVVNNFKSASENKDGAKISIPKFKFDHQLDFENDLKALGVKSIFSEDADFSKMASEPLVVSEAVHKANIDFSEDGIKAAAITVFAMKATSAMDEKEPQPDIISINHPFLFLIRDVDNGTIWFTGAVYQPNLWENDVESYRPSRY